MSRTLVPRLLIYPLVVVFIINLGAIYSRPPMPDSQGAALVKLLKWHDPISGDYHIRIDRTTPLDQQIIQLQNLKELI